MYKFIEEEERLLLNEKIALEKNKLVNAEIEKLENRLLQEQQFVSELKGHVQDLEVAYKMCVKEDTSYRERRITFLSNYITEEIAKIFPNEGYTAKINYDYKNRNKVATLSLIDLKGHESSPEICEGLLLQYLISYSVVIAIAKALNISNLYIDEAFGAASSDNLPKIGDRIKDSVADGIQTLMITQREELYADIPRREIVLEKNPNTKSVQIVSCKDY